MKFKKGLRRQPIEYEKALVEYWKDKNVFEKSVAERPQDNSYVFYDGPPFITGVPHHGTLLSSIVKDAVPRYWTMKGKRVERRWGWDCHGLPAEVFTEKKLGIQDKRDIGTKISLEEYILTCRENMIATGDLWESTIERIGRWVDFKGAYRTMDKEYMESIWWGFKQLYEKGKIYEGEKVLLYCIRDATPISKAEVAMDNSYQDDTDPSVYVKLKLVDNINNASLLAWTTTPWTLPSNTAAAVNRDVEYSEVQFEDGEVVIVATDMINTALTDEKHRVVPHTIIRSYKGSELVGKAYEPLFGDRGENAHRVWHADYVNLDEGTGVVHLSPAYGEEDYQLAKDEGVPIVSNLDDNGIYTEGEWQGSQVWEVNKQIAKTLHERGVVWKITYITHSYPHCHRCNTKLIYRAHPSWFLNIQDQREEMLATNESITWFPEHIKHGRFEKTIESAPDWNLSRDRFWATAMPVWKGTDADGQEHVKVVGSYQELKELSGIELLDYHRPWIDDVTFTIDGVTYRRIDKVLDGWFESGSMPYAQFHYPFENVEKFEANSPGDFIAEYVGQVRAWFYYLHAISVGLFDKHAFNNVIVTGTLAGNDGRKMSKSYGNYTDPNELMDRFSADALRFLLLSSPVLNAEDFALLDKDVADVNRKLSMVWNMYDFFTLYADVDNWEWNGSLEDPSEGWASLEVSDDAQNLVLDKWIIARVHQLTQEVDEAMQRYDLPAALKPILPFIDDASNWYVRRSRKRFWKSDNDDDKQRAYTTLHYVLVRLAVVMAPFTPFLSDELYIKLTGNESVHLCLWPANREYNNELIHSMSLVRSMITDGLAQRAQASIKVRQPLKMVTVYGVPSNIFGRFEEIIKDELNVKGIEYKDTQNNEAAHVLLDTELDDELLSEGLARDVVRQVQAARKAAGLEINDRIRLRLTSTDVKSNQSMERFKAFIMAETLSSELIIGGQEQPLDYSVVNKLESGELAISLGRATNLIA